MRKLLLILVIAIVAIAANGQTATFEEIPEYHTFKQIDIDYTLTNTTESWFKFTAKKDMMTIQDFQCVLEEGTGSHTNVAVALYGRKFDDDSWVQIGSTVNWTLSTADTTITISNTAYNAYRYYKASFTGTGTGTSTIDQMKFKQWK